MIWIQNLILDNSAVIVALQETWNLTYDQLSQMLLAGCSLVELSLAELNLAKSSLAELQDLKQYD